MAGTPPGSGRLTSSTTRRPVSASSTCSTRASGTPGPPAGVVQLGPGAGGDGRAGAGAAVQRRVVGGDEDAVGGQPQVDLGAVGAVEQAGGEGGQGVLDGGGTGRAAVGVEAHAATVPGPGDAPGRPTWTAGAQRGTTRRAAPGRPVVELEDADVALPQSTHGCSDRCAPRRRSYSRRTATVRRRALTRCPSRFAACQARERERHRACRPSFAVVRTSSSDSGRTPWQVQHRFVASMQGRSQRPPTALVGRVGLDPTTIELKARCSTN